MRKTHGGDAAGISITPIAATTTLKFLRTANNNNNNNNETNKANRDNMLGPTNTDPRLATENSCATTTAAAQYQHYHSNDNCDKTTYHGNNSNNKSIQQHDMLSLKDNDNNIALQMKSRGNGNQHTGSLTQHQTIQQTSRLEGFNQQQHNNKKHASTPHMKHATATDQHTANNDKTTMESHKTHSAHTPPSTAAAAATTLRSNATANSSNSNSSSSTINTSNASTIATTKPPASFHIKSLIASASPNISNSSNCAASAKSSSLSLLNVFFFLICLSSLAFSLYANIRQTHSEHSLRHLRLIDERLEDMEMQLRLQQQQLQQFSADMELQRKRLSQTMFTNAADTEATDDDDEEVDGDEIDEEFDGNPEDSMSVLDNAGDYAVADVIPPFGRRNRGLNSVLNLDNSKDVNQAVRLLTRQVGELHRLRRGNPQQTPISEQARSGPKATLPWKQDDHLSFKGANNPACHITQYLC
uniref:Uncharacterized protein n=1 Tax=Stomoxys calcitrans TaxID=35570 RepID=A0A1I8NN37_STOCA